MANAAAVALAIKITADTKQGAAGIDDVTTKTTRMGKAGNVAGKLLAGGLLVAGAAALKAADAAAADEAAQAKYANTLRNTTGATDAAISKSEAWIATQGKLYGVTDDELRPALTTLVAATNDVAKAQDLAAIAQNIAATKGVSLESVTKKLAKAQTNGAAGLAAYGVQAKDASGETRDLATVTAELADKYKNGAAKAAETTAGKQKILKVQLGELQEQIGAKLIPVLAALAAVGLKVVDWISDNQTAALAIIGTLGGLLAIVKAVSIATEVWSAVTKTFTAVQAALNIVMSANPAVLVVVAIVALAAALVIAYKRSETFRDIVNAVFEKIANVVSTVVDFIRDHWKLLLAILTGPIGLAVLAIAKHWDSIKSGAIDLKDKIAGYATAIKDALVGAFEAVVGKVQAVYDKILSAINKAKELAQLVIPGGKSSPQAPGPIGGVPGAGGNTGQPSARRAPQASQSRTVNINNYGAVIDRTAVNGLTTVLRQEGYTVGGVIGA